MGRGVSWDTLHDTSLRRSAFQVYEYMSRNVSWSLNYLRKVLRTIRTCCGQSHDMSASLTQFGLYRRTCRGYTRDTFTLPYDATSRAKGYKGVSTDTCRGPCPMTRSTVLINTCERCNSYVDNRTFRTMCLRHVFPCLFSFLSGGGGVSWVWNYDTFDSLLTCRGFEFTTRYKFENVS